MKRVCSMFLILFTVVNLSAQEVNVTTDSSSLTATPKMVKLDNNHYLYGDTVLSREQYVNHLQSHCTLAYTQYKKGTTRVHAAIGCLAAGAALEICGSVLLGLEGGGGIRKMPAIRRAPKFEGDEVQVIGYAFIAIGSALEIACIPLWITGSISRKNSLNTFNTACLERDKTNIALQLKINSNGLGLAVSF